jgi:hypothetical protein
VEAALRGRTGVIAHDAAAISPRSRASQQDGWQLTYLSILLRSRQDDATIATARGYQAGCRRPACLRSRATHGASIDPARPALSTGSAVPTSFGPVMMLSLAGRSDAGSERAGTLVCGSRKPERRPHPLQQCSPSLHTVIDGALVRGCRVALRVL